MNTSFSVLGPVRAWCGDRELRLGPPKQRALLALLLLQAGHPVTLHEIVDVLWGEDPPGSAVNVVQRHIGGLRRLVEPDLPVRGASRWLVRDSGGYRLETDDLDLLRFRDLRRRAARAAGEGDLPAALDALDAALGLWRGPVASGIAPEIRSHPVFAAVDGEYPAAVKEAADLALRAGRGSMARVLPPLRGAAARYPLDEALQARLMLLLAATGHQAQALDVYRGVHTLLAEELGVRPGRELRDAQRRVLAGGHPEGEDEDDRPSTPESGTPVPGTARSAASPPAPGPEARGRRDTAETGAERRGAVGAGEVGGTEDRTADAESESEAATEVVSAAAYRAGAGTDGSGRAGPGGVVAVHPAQLPADLPAFTGRDRALADLGQLLPPDGTQPHTVAIAAIGGTAGVGKTSLAIHWARSVIDRFPDGQLYVDLRGFHPSGSVMSPVEALRSFLDALGVPSSRIPAGLDAQAALYRSMLARRRMLIVLDNARDTEHVRPLLPGAPGCMVVVTSRSQLYGLIAGEGAHPVTLDLPSEAEALEFLSRRLGARRVAEEPAAAARIVASCGRLPLALAIVSARAVVNPDFALSAIAAELRASADSLDAFAGEAPVADARSAFSWSYRLLTPDAARLFRLLALHPGPDCSVRAAAALAGREPGRVQPLLAELVRAQLLSETAPGRFGCHELLRAYGGERGRAEDPAPEPAAARRRMLDHYLHGAYAADRVLRPRAERFEPAAPDADTVLAGFADQAGAVDWLEANLSVLLAAIEQDARSGGRHSWQLAAALEPYLDRNGRRQEQLAAQTAAVESARRLGDVRGQAHAHRALGFAAGRLDRWTEADGHLARALKLFGEIGDPAGQGRTHRYLAFLANRRGRHDEALDHYARACSLYRAAGRTSGEASVTNEVGWTYILTGRYEEALRACERALAMHRRIGDRNGEAAAWDSLGYAHHHLHAHERALGCYARALTLYRDIRDRYLEADTLVHIGDTHRAARDEARAREAWRQALDVLEDIAHPEAERVRHRLERTPAVAATGP